MTTVSVALYLRKKRVVLLEGEGVVVLAGLAVSHQVARLLAQPEQRLCICPADRSVVPATEKNQKKKNQQEIKMRKEKK